MLRRDMMKLGLLAGLPIEAKAKLPKRPPEITLKGEKGAPLTHAEMDNNMRALRALIERLEWSDDDDTSPQT
jgi:hypothetical protein